MPLKSRAVDAVEAEAVAAIERGEIEARGKAASFAEHHIALPGTVVPVRIAFMGANDEIAKAVPIHVPGPGHRPAAVVPKIDAVEAEAVAAIERGEIEARSKASRLAEHHKALPGTVIPVRSAERSADDKIAEAIAIHIPRRRHRPAAYVTGIYAVKPEAVAAIERLKPDRRRKFSRECGGAQRRGGKKGQRPYGVVGVRAYPS